MTLPPWLDYATWESPRWKTAIARNTFSMPMRLAIEQGEVTKDFEVMDFGCGRGADVDNLRKHGVPAFGFDPYYCNCPAELEETDIISCIYVLNVVERPEERVELIRFVWELTRKRLLLAVRTEKGEEGFTSAGTFQVYYSRQTFADLILEALPDVAIRFLKPGVVVIRK